VTSQESSQRARLSRDQAAGIWVSRLGQYGGRLCLQHSEAGERGISVTVQSSRAKSSRAMEQWHRAGSSSAPGSGSGRAWRARKRVVRMLPSTSGNDDVGRAGRSVAAAAAAAALVPGDSSHSQESRMVQRQAVRTLKHDNSPDKWLFDISEEQLLIWHGQMLRRSEHTVPCRGSGVLSIP